jgi:ABC-type polysaccharide/polyol phosphate transport system ATPase subunit/ABC-type polysaccharide/polyol phosphate export permease
MDRTLVRELAAGSAPPIERLEAPAVAVANLHKTFLLPHQRYSSVRDRMLHPFQSRSFEPLEALRDVSLDVAQGEFFAIVGRNGSGKSTLLRCLAGIYPVDSGTIAVQGRLAPFIELGVGFNTELPARDNVVTNAVVFGLSRKEAVERADEMIAFAELERFADQKLKNFSTGMGVRLAFAVTAHVDADIFLFDEVLAVGDAAFKKKCFAHFDRLRAQGKTVVLVTHDMTLVTQRCDRALLIDNGRVVAMGAPDAIAEEYENVNAGRPLGRGALRQPAEPVTSVPRHAPPRPGLITAPPRRIASLARLLAANELKVKYTDARLSYLWAIGRPLGLFAILLLVFTRIGRFDTGVDHYPAYLLMAVVLWTFFAVATETSVNSLVRRSEFLRKLPFPPLAVPLAQIATSLVDLAANLVVVLGLGLLFGIVPSAAWLELLPLIAVLALFATGFSLMLSAAFVRHRDLHQIWAVLLQGLFFCTPIFYVATFVPEPFDRLLVILNPVATVITQARHAVIDPAAPTAAGVAGGYVFLLIPLAIVLAVVVLGLRIFARESPKAAESV